MKIALWHNLPSGGARRAMAAMVKGLAERGHTIDEYCPATAERACLPVEGTVRASRCLPVRLHGVWRRRVPLVTPYVTAARLMRDLATMDGYARAAAQEIDAGGYDVAFLHDCQLVQNPDLPRYLATPSILYCHHGARAMQAVPPAAAPRLDFRRRAAATYYALPKRAYPWLAARCAKANIRAAGKVLTNSDFAREALYRAYGVDSRVCTLGVDTECFRPLGLAHEPFVLSVGAIHYHKGYRFLIPALGAIPPAQRPPLVIAANDAEPEEQAAITTLARQAGVQLRIVRVTDQEELVALYNRASAFVYAPIMEPWGLAAVEALACGAPVVAVGEGGVRESMVDGETALLVARDAAAFAAAVDRVLTDRALACRLGQAGAAYVRRHFTWEATTAQIEQQLAEGLVTP